MLDYRAAVLSIGEATALLTALFSPSEGSAVPKLLKPELDIYVAVYFFILQFVLNWGIRLLVVTVRYLLDTTSTVNTNVTFSLQPIARLLLGAKAKQSKIDKFAQASMEFLFYGSFTLIGLAVVPNQAWVWPSNFWWTHPDGRVLMNDPIMMDDALKCYYLLYGTRYAQAILSVLLEHKRKDFLEMIVHHVATVVVVAVSFVGGYYRIGAVIMLLFDPADVFLHAAKQFKYIGFGTLADIFFVLFMASFFISRCFLYPYCCWSAHFELETYVTMTSTEWTCVGMLYILLALNFFWMYLIFKVLYGLITKGAAEDVRSDSEDEEEDGDKSKKRQ
jgi:ceramide synthetase